VEVLQCFFSCCDQMEEILSFPESLWAGRIKVTAHTELCQMLLFIPLLRDIYWQKFNGFWRIFQRVSAFCVKIFCIQPNKENILCPLDLALFSLVYILSPKR
jgi:hypothetical protein